MGPATFFRLMAEHGSAAAALAALPGIAAEAGIENYIPCTAEAARSEATRGRAAGARMLAFGATGYPAALTEIPDPPPILWARGNSELPARPMIALVGARNASSLGTRMARKMAQELGEAGFVVVSGLARGIDAAAHTGALDSGTVAVLAGGVDVAYPQENAGLAQDIAARGLLLSEAPMGLQPMARHFPRRNRIVSGLARAVVVVEAAAQSGSLITARNALDQGREVLAVPGHPFDGRASGCNHLIRDGATLVRGAADVIEALSADASRPVPSTDHCPPAARVTGLADLVLERIGAGPVSEDQLARDLRAPPDQLAPTLVELEIDGRISRDPGGLLVGLPNPAD